MVSIDEALRAAQDQGLDLVEISPNAEPPVCRIMDFGRYQFEQTKKKQQAKKKQKRVDIKELKFRPGIGENDYQVKLTSLIRFLEYGHKVKITLRFRGREFSHQELGLQLLSRLKLDVVQHGGVVEQEPKLEGRQMMMLVAPGSIKQSIGVQQVALDREQEPAAE